VPVTLAVLARAYPKQLSKFIMAVACLLFLCLVHNPSHAQNSLSKPPVLKIKSDLPEPFEIIRHMSVRADASETADIEAIRALPEDRWRNNDLGSQNFGQTGKPLWFHLRLQGNYEQSATYFLEIAYAHLDYLDLYAYQGDEQTARYLTGDKRVFASRPVDSESFVFPIPLSNSVTEVYLRVQTQGVMKLPVRLHDADSLSQASDQFSLFTGVYFGAILIMLVYNGFIYLTVRDKSYLFYLVYIASSALLQLTLTGLAFKLFWPSTPEVNEFVIIVTATLVTVSAIGFIVRFVGINKVTTRGDYIWMNLIVGGFILVLITNWFISYNVALKATYVLVSVAVMTGFYVGVKYWLKGIKSARFFAMAWFSYLVFITMYILESSQVISPNIFSTHAFSLGSLIELSILSIAFADKLNEEKELRVKAQDDLLDIQIRMNEELDALVKNRTQELEDANERLKELSVTDSLTQLKNRYYFDQSFRREFKRAARERWPFTVMMIDIDHFKQLNDTYGHLFGDFCLKRAAELVTSIIRRPSDIAARYGGEEFAILLPNTHLDGGMRLGEKIREQFKETEIGDGGVHLYLTVSIGVASCLPEPDMSEYRTSLLELADQCLYKAKENGRDQVVGKQYQK